MFASVGAKAKAVVTRFMYNPSQSRWNAKNMLFGYLERNEDHNIVFVLEKTATIVGYTDSYFVGYLEN